MNKKRITELIRLFKMKSTSTDKTPVMIFDDADKEIIISAIVVRTDRYEEGKNIYGIRYYNIENKIREKIIQSIFVIMRSQKKTN